MLIFSGVWAIAKGMNSCQCFGRVSRPAASSFLYRGVAGRGVIKPKIGSPGGQLRISFSVRSATPGVSLSMPKIRSEEHTSELQSRLHLVCRLLLEKKNTCAHDRRRLVLPPQYHELLAAVERSAAHVGLCHEDPQPLSVMSVVDVLQLTVLGHYLSH